MHRVLRKDAVAARRFAWVLCPPFKMRLWRFMGGQSNPGADLTLDLIGSKVRAVVTGTSYLNISSVTNDVVDANDLCNDTAHDDDLKTAPVRRSESKFQLAQSQ